MRRCRYIGSSPVGVQIEQVRGTDKTASIRRVIVIRQAGGSVKRNRYVVYSLSGAQNRPEAPVKRDRSIVSSSFKVGEMRMEYAAGPARQNGVEMLCLAIHGAKREKRP